METKAKKRDQASDLPETENDKKQLEPDEATLDLPEVKDIPGQEHVRPFLPGEMADTTISSADEEANELLDIDEDILSDNETNVTIAEKDLLRRSSESMSTADDQQLNYATLDNTDDEGTPLNEKVNLSGSDLDVPGSEEDDANEKIGEEDEENNAYSLRDPDDD
ncbi:MAG TPA: hypothetical protein VFH07_01140 [Chitinophagaceae bacterium]|jgi:hypothetical protein|nr:hypothetical protein [Chitinophagaceae bacterium]